MFKKGLLSLAASALLASSAMAVNIANDGTGDYLVAPMYTFDNGYKTHLTIMNTDNEHAYVVRAVIRRDINSTHVRDFDLVLSPGDVWEGTIEECRVHSDDPSYWGNTPDDLLDEELTLPEAKSKENPKGCVKNGYIDFHVVVQFDNNNPLVQQILQSSNYSKEYKNSGTVDISKMDKAALKSVAELFEAGDLDVVTGNKNINNDAIGGFVRIESTTNGLLSTAIPLFAFEDTRKNGSGDLKEFERGKYLEPGFFLNEPEVRDLIRFDNVSIPYHYIPGEADTRAVFTFPLNSDYEDERLYKQVIRNMEEKYPMETAYCLDGAELEAYVQENFEDAWDPIISPYDPPTCELKYRWPILKFTKEVDGIKVSQAIKNETKKTYYRVITYKTKLADRKTVEEPFNWNDVDPADYTAGMYQIHDIINNDPDPSTKAAYIPTFFDIKFVDGVPFMNWNYAIRN